MDHERQGLVPDLLGLLAKARMAYTAVPIANTARTAVAMAVISAERSLDMGGGYAARWP